MRAGPNMRIMSLFIACHMSQPNRLESIFTVAYRKAKSVGCDVLLLFVENGVNIEPSPANGIEPPLAAIIKTIPEDDKLLPEERSKDGKRFGFVRFVNVFNVERLVSNLCTIWVDRSKFHANIARFHRAHLNNNKVSTEQKFGYNRNINNVRANEGVTTGLSKSYVQAVKVKNMFGALECDSMPSIVLDDECLISKDLSKACWKGWRLKAFPLNYGLKILLNGLPLSEESYWTLMIRKRKVFIRKEVPGWVPEFVDNSDDDDESDNGFKDGDAKVKDGGRCENDNDEVQVPETVFEESLNQKVNQSEDPFGIYLLLNKNKDKFENMKPSDHSLKYHPGSTPNGDNNEFCMHEENVRSVNQANSLNSNMEENKNGHERNSTNKGSKEEISGSQMDLECAISKEELKRAVWECGTDKSPGPDGFSFGFYRQFWSSIENDVFAAISHFFTFRDIPNGCNSCFIALIPKVPDANLVKDFRPISLIGSMYKIIAKILVNRLVGVLEDIVNEVQSAFITERQILDGHFILNEVIQWCKLKKKQSLIFKVDFEKAYDSVRWDFLDDSLHLSFQRVVDVGMFKGINLSPLVNLSHMFYANDAVFVGQWCDSNINTLVHVLECFFQASGLRINMCESKIMGVNVGDEKVKSAASKLRCLILNTPFSYLGTKVRGNMSRVQAWTEVVDKVGKVSRAGSRSCWRNIVNEVRILSNQVLKYSFPRIYALETKKEVTVNSKMSDTRWVWSLEGSREFSVASIRKIIDGNRLSTVDARTLWIKYVPIKVNVLAWKIKIEALPTRFNISRRCIDIDSILCPISLMDGNESSLRASMITK
uniref:RNA-directed DNA polymerase, eukaryota, reverse transcriptase zinc-binding domain protein n=1 Tax=Tanacetum cinerariifolium TaxID=118510 RepID=A0A6L2JVB1_TANCI|nr:RNA-directed DNA polymerase, eukaryota, reverse transcriptase zinc-binding domain protein [Tanacetum cinerariifolium]